MLSFIKLIREHYVRGIYFTFCLFVCLYQIYKICEIYFSYETITSVRYENIAIISIPALTLCFEKKDVLKEEYMNRLNQSDNESELRENVNKFAANFTIKEQLEKLYLDHDQIFNACAVYQSQGLKGVKEDRGGFGNSYYDCNKIAPIRKSIDNA